MILNLYISFCQKLEQHSQKHFVSPRSRYYHAIGRSQCKCLFLWRCYLPLFWAGFISHRLIGHHASLLYISYHSNNCVVLWLLIFELCEGKGIYLYYFFILYPAHRIATNMMNRHNLCRNIYILKEWINITPKKVYLNVIQ